MFPRVTHPSATPALLRAFDLHVLSLPPAFVLSQDQTLKLIEILSRLVTYQEPLDPQSFLTSSKHIRSNLNPPARLTTFVRASSVQAR